MRYVHMLRRIAIAGIFLLLFMHCDDAFAQYFGRNKVKYQDFNFKVLKTENFDIYHYPATAAATEDAALMMERWYARFALFFGHTFKQRQPLIVYANHADFQQTNVVSGLIGQGTGGVTEGFRKRIVLPYTGIYADNHHVLGHELVHAFQFDIAETVGGSKRNMNQAPLWFIEGMAEYLTIGREDPLTAMWLRDALLHDDLPTIDQITRNPEYFPYRYGHALWSYLGSRFGDRIVPGLYFQVLQQGLKPALRAITGDSLDALSRKWQAAVRQTYEAQLEGCVKPEQVGQRLLATAGGINLAPAISPDGRYVAFLSRRDLFTIDLFLADARTGKVLKKLVSSNSDAHFDALRFMDSAGSWSPESDRLAFVVFSGGKNAVAILDAGSQEVERTIKMPSVGGITHLAWSPDGQKLAISGTEGGISDLFLYDLQSRDLRQLTDDRYADLQPAWAPDSRTIAFVTDRGGITSFERFTFARPRIGLYDLETGDISLLVMSEQVKHINPQFSPDGEALYFIADPDGFSNIYRHEFAAETFHRVTNVATGITGITELAPALSVAQRSGRLVFSVFENRDYIIYALDETEARGEPISTLTLAGDGALPPAEQSNEGEVESYLRDPLLGLGDGGAHRRSDYNASLGLSRVGQSGIGVGIDRYGSSIGGWVGFIFSDMLNNHMLGVTARANGSIQDIGGQVSYINQQRRLHWGAAVSHVPYRTGFTTVSLDTVSIGGEPVLARENQLIVQRVFSDRIDLFAEYPLSTNRRFEFSGGFTRISFDYEFKRVLIAGGRIIERQEGELDNPDGLNLVRGSIAYVGDYSFFGFNSPVTGSRFRFEIEPTVGSLNYAGLLADYRQYMRLKPLTFAVRAMHYGRYLGDADNPRLPTLFVGYPTLVRGYDVNSFDVGECSETGTLDNCPEFNRLQGSRIGVLNAELRLPLLGTRQLGLINFPYLATELSTFVDAGIAWSTDESPVLKLARHSRERIPVFSAGLAARVNVFGAVSAQFYYAYPFQRPETGWQFGFVLAPGW